MECMNPMCEKSYFEEWVEGWPLKSGGFAALCHSCGTMYKNLVFCETFHSQESGWRDCTSCGKRLHGGCIASSSMIKLLDTGGVSCKICTRNSSFSTAPYHDKIRTYSLKENSVDLNMDTVEPAKCRDYAETWFASICSVASDYISGSSDKPLQAGSSDKTLAPTNLSISLSADGFMAEAKESSSCQQGPLLGLLPKLSNSGPASGLEHNSSIVPRVERIIKNQPLPRYWPRITDPELQQISQDSNSIIVPLFEKVLSARDAGRIGRLVLPKACAEAYFPPITRPEGLPLRIQDVKGNEWMLQYRFWPNNNSRMYVLEGVSPCIQAMQLQAGDTMTFSRIDPARKLLMGCRKASTTTVFRNGSLFETEHNLLAPSLVFPRHKRRNIGSKNKRLVINEQDSLELSLTWEEVQDMLRPSPTAQLSTFSVDDHEFEEFEEQPVFAKKSIFVVRLSGEYEQFTHCDSCLKWRKLPADFLVPSKWTCRDNMSDLTRSSCSAPDELSSSELQFLLGMNKELVERVSTEALAISESTTFIATSTKHPRHRPGCSCIVCIQPPSGKGSKHKPTCTCTLCMTIKKRFKTLMMRKNRHQSETEAEVKRIRIHNDSVSEIKEPGCHGDQEGIDLNSVPFGELAAIPGSHVSMMSLLEEANLPLETYLRENGIKSLEGIAPALDKKEFSYN